MLRSTAAEWRPPLSRPGRCSIRSVPCQPIAVAVTGGLVGVGWIWAADGVDRVGLLSRRMVSLRPGRSRWEASSM